MSLIAACLLVVAETCLPRRCLATSYVIMSKYYISRWLNLKFEYTSILRLLIATHLNTSSRSLQPSVLIALRKNCYSYIHILHKLKLCTLHKQNPYLDEWFLVPVYLDSKFCPSFWQELAFDIVLGIWGNILSFHVATTIVPLSALYLLPLFLRTSNLQTKLLQLAIFCSCTS